MAQHDEKTTWWNNPPGEVIHLADDQEIKAQVNGKNVEGDRGSIFHQGRSIDVVLVDGRWKQEEK